MRSEIRTRYNFLQAINEWDWKSAANVKAVQENMYQVGLKYKSYIDESVVQKGDVATVKMESDVKKFNRTINLHVGDNLFDETLEADLINRSTHTEYVFSHPKGQIKYTILDCKRLFIPPVSDEMAKNEGIENVETERQLYRYFYLSSLKEDIYNESFDFVDHLVTLCEYDISEEDVKTFEELEMDRCRKISQEQNMVFDEMTESELLGAVGCRNIAEFRKMIRCLFTKEIKASLYMEKMFQAKKAENFEDVLGNYVGLLDIVRERAFHKLMKEAV